MQFKSKTILEYISQLTEDREKTYFKTEEYNKPKYRQGIFRRN